MNAMIPKRIITLAVKKQLQSLSAEEELELNQYLEQEKLAGIEAESTACCQELREKVEKAILDNKKENMKKRLKQRLTFRS